MPALSEKYEPCRLEYIEGTMSLREVAEKYGFKTKTIEKRAEREKWSAQRREVAARVASEHIAATVKKKLKELEDWNTGDLNIAKRMRNYVALQIFDPKDPGSTAKLDHMPADKARTLCAIAESAQKLARLALDSTTQNTGVSAPDGTPLPTETKVPTLQDFYAGMRFVVADPSRYEYPDGSPAPIPPTH